MKEITSFNKSSVEPSTDYPKAERLVSGNPKRTTWNYYTSDKSDLYCGVWASEVGAWRIAYPDNMEEFFHVLEGRIRLKSDNGNVEDFGPGEACVIPAGFQGIFEVLEATKKHYVILER